ncbi:hypothetical protein HQ393_02100 [Chitinibacter bivalviorum]|uniref:Uncharacterized protein n=1 Tax=Chitinibacter bivalviorum TaxID=2739434 RepID=A0A7H9BHW3_9NEIS|nr:hypothetical protein [Chitinibacter bivalviorum]QLG87134.1 hypothetical protein HQ393_02100 [Chitinibacter bivalviorum]
MSPELIDQQNMALHLAQLDEQPYTLGQLQESYQAAKAINYHRGMVIALRNIAYFYTVQPNPEQALQHLRKALNLAKKMHLVELLGGLNHEIANTYLSLGNYARAQDFWINCLEFAAELKDAPLFVKAYVGIGGIFLAHQNYALALQYQDKALFYATEIKDARLTIELHMNRASTLYRLKYFDAALAVLQHIHQAAEDSSNITWKSEIHTYLGMVHLEMGRMPEATTELNLGLQFAQQGGGLWCSALNALSLGRLYLYLQKNDEAKQWLLIALDKARQFNATSLIQDAHQLLESLYETEGNFALALEHHLQYNQTTLNALQNDMGHKRAQKVDPELKTLTDLLQLESCRLRYQRSRPTT